MFRWIVAICLMLIAYGVLYHDLPCWMQLLDKTVYCQLEEAGKKEREFEKAHHGKSRFQVGLEKWAKDLEKTAKRRAVNPSSNPVSEGPIERSVPLETLPQSVPAAPGTVPPTLIQRVDAEYTSEALEAKLQGKVVLNGEVDLTGHVVNPRVVRSLGLGLDEKAIEAVRQWRYRPAIRDGEPVAFPMQIQFDFRLGNR